MINFGVAAAAGRSTGQAHISKSCRNGSKSSARVLRARRRDKPQSCQQQDSWQTPPPMQQLIRVLSASIMAAVVLATAHGQGPAPSPLISLPSPPPTNVSAVAPQPSPPPALTKSDFETFLDALIPSQLQNRDIAGAVVSVVKDGQVLFAKGYGYADFAAKKPVVADQTLFRPGSISKVFTATAVMQLVEQGKLDLDRDVNEYLDFAIPKTFAEPVTLRRLLTHTARFQEPLGMERSTFMQPLPPELEATMSQGYMAAAQGPKKFEFTPAAPAGALSTTGTDMTRFMLAFLAEGTLDGATILKPETVRMMETRQLDLPPEVRTLGLILMEYPSNGQRIVGHAGDSFYFHSDMILIPDARIGLFVSYNSAGSRFGGGRG